MSNDIDPTEPPEPGDGSGMRAKNLKNLPLIIRPKKVDTATGKDGDDYEYIGADVWVLDSSGIVDSGTGVQFSWWRAREQLRNRVGEFVACRPAEQDDNSVILVPLKDKARKVAEQVIAELKRESDAGLPPPPSEEPF